jgi:hypothetical protein
MRLDGTRPPKHSESSGGAALQLECHQSISHGTACHHSYKIPTGNYNVLAFSYNCMWNINVNLINIVEEWKPPARGETLSLDQTRGNVYERMIITGGKRR